jgi:hypothetical protein
MTRRIWLVVGGVLAVGIAAGLGIAGALGGDARDPAGTASRRSMATRPADPAATETSKEMDSDRVPVQVGDAALLPNLRSLEAETVYVVSAGGGRLLRFAGVLANTGVGPLEIVPQETPRCPAGQRHVAQAVYQDGDGDGLFDRAVDTAKVLAPSGCMLDHPTHMHWHFDGSARYSLLRPGEETAVVVRDKVSFCLRDNRRTGRDAGPAQARHYPGDCERDDVQGITGGWADVYRATLPGQSLLLPDDLADGVYCLRLDADPEDLLRESDENDNSATRGIRIEGSDVTMLSPAASSGCTAG